jgi:flavin reductase (DIM6/NTAB) family NADH-FMN oxidoreductase RutF
MTASAMFVSQMPPLIAVSLSKTSRTYEIIEKSREFAINVIADNQLDLAKKFGGTHGHELDKFKEFDVATEPASKIGGSLLSGCFANIECRVISSLRDFQGNYAVCIGEVLSFKMNEGLRPLVWLKNRYFRVGTECRL